MPGLGRVAENPRRAVAGLSPAIASPSGHPACTVIAEEVEQFTFHAASMALVLPNVPFNLCGE